jgi:hypothetical protein
LAAGKQVLKALLAAKEESDAVGWQRFQSEVHALKLRRSRISSEVEELQRALEVAEDELRLRAREEGGAGRQTDNKDASVRMGATYGGQPRDCEVGADSGRRCCGRTLDAWYVVE